MAIVNDMVVAIEYEVRDNATKDLIDSNVGKEPLEFITGRGQIIPGLESKIIGMESGQSDSVTVPSADAYGEYDESKVGEQPKEQFAGIDLQKGMTLYGQDEMGQMIQVVVKDFDEQIVTIDYNHPLAGKDLMFEITISDVRAATDKELATGQVGADDESCGCGSGCGCH